MAGDERKHTRSGPTSFTSHFVVFLAGIVIGVLVQPFFVPDTSPQLFVPETAHQNCPKCDCNFSLADCPETEDSECPEVEECEVQDFEACEVCSETECPLCPSTENSETQCPVWWDRVSQDYFPQGVQKQFKGAMGQGWWFLGCKSDVDEVLDILKNFYKGPDADGVFVDIGANLGQVSENIIQTFGNIPWNRYKRKFGLDGLYCKNDPHPGVEIYMFEPQPNNAKRIRERMEYSFWHLERIHLIEAAVSNYTGTAEFVYTGEYSETGTLAEKANNRKGDDETRIQVEVLRFDDAYERNLKGKNIFMLKCDTEGFDGTVVRGMPKVLASGKLRFLTFEYHSLWFDNETGDTLRDILDILESHNYMCYFILPNRLLPIGFGYWQKMFEMRRWSNVFCGKKDDFLLEKLVIMYHIATLGDRKETNKFETKDDAMKWYFK